MSNENAPLPTGSPTLALLEGESEGDQKNRRISIAVAVVVHIMAFVITFPALRAATAQVEAKKPKIHILKQVKFKKPPKPDIPPPPKPKTKKVPIPDPTPDEPEPIREEPPDEELDFVPDDAFIPDIPDAPPPPPTGPVRFVIGGDIKEPIKTNAPNPVYPEPARRARVQGVVILELLLDTNGGVQNIKVIKPLPLGLTEAAVDAVRKWRFTPATRQGKPVEVIYTLTVRFSLN